MIELYAVICSNPRTVEDFAFMSSADVIRWGDEDDGYLFLSRFPPVAPKESKKIVIESTVRIPRDQGKLILERAKDRVFYRHPWSSFRDVPHYPKRYVPCYPEKVSGETEVKMATTLGPMNRILESLLREGDL